MFGFSERLSDAEEKIDKLENAVRKLAGELGYNASIYLGLVTPVPYGLVPALKEDVRELEEKVKRLETLGNDVAHACQGCGKLHTPSEIK